jgi:hypothetical protein
MNISITDFWGGFDNNNNTFVDILKGCNKKINFIPLSEDTDILIYSCFGSGHQSVDRNKVKKVYYTGENIRPNFNECDYSITFDFNSHDGKNIRFPVWMLNIDFFDKKTYGNPEYLVPPDFITNFKSNPYYNAEKKHFCSIITTALPNRRDEMVNKLNDKKTVDGYGPAFNKERIYGIDKKLEIISKYKFNICFENSITPGYYTEKLVDARVAGTVPIYYSDSNVNVDFNVKGILNLNDYNSMEEFVEKIMEVDNNQSLYEEMINEPIFSNNVPLLDRIEAIKEFFNEKILN